MIACILSFGMASGGCALGPKALEKTHGRYNEAIHRVDEEQLLRNLVRLRYDESPYQLNVSSIAAQYELAGQAEARPFFIAPNPSNSNIIFRTFTSVLPDLLVSGANRPTITMTPASDGDAVQRFLTPISADTLVFLGQTSWPVSTVLRLWVERLNGVPNAPSASGPQRCEVPDFARFRRVAELLQAAQDQGLGTVHAEERPVELSGPLPPPTAGSDSSTAVEAAKNGLKYLPREDGSGWGLFRSERRLVLDLTPQGIDHPDTLELEALLHLQPGQARYAIVVTPGIDPDPLRMPLPQSAEIKILLRSTAQVFYYLANGVEVPSEHLDTGIIRPMVGPDGISFDSRNVTAGLFNVHACRGHKPPQTAFIAVKYRDYWYYIDDRDQTSKATFALVLQLSRLDFARQQHSGTPFLTLPVGR
ncbi:hypothetical protein Sinac_6171 [Singulisphaera acidiphila DSM 18658]|uniref:Uncharacterized protein n=2 Tax=Singulisphaera acidiphila TaxID=466153 RepID=L0DN68_SINAD|nr:hypothetical protein Sinac_6171 [Singulisphaera acidiphila DSM 18658]